MNELGRMSFIAVYEYMNFANSITQKPEAYTSDGICIVRIGNVARLA